MVGNGCKAEIAIRWYDYQSKIVPRLEVFPDSFELLRGKNTEVLDAIDALSKEDFTSEELSCILLQLGYTDMSDKKLQS